MKNLLIILSLVLGANSLKAQDSPAVKDTSVAVQGNCEMCKSRIEKAAMYVKGVKKANWDADKQLLSVSFRTDKTTLTEIEKSIAKVGYDTANIKADKADYESLPGCCQYRTVEKH